MMDLASATQNQVLRIHRRSDKSTMHLEVKARIYVLMIIQVCYGLVHGGINFQGNKETTTIRGIIDDCLSVIQISK